MNEDHEQRIRQLEKDMILVRGAIRAFIVVAPWGIAITAVIVGVLR